MTNIDDVTITKWVLRPKIDTKLARNTLNAGTIGKQLLNYLTELYPRVNMFKIK